MSKRILQRGSAALALLSLATVARVAAHHSFATFDEAQEIRIEGTLADFDFVNPHARVELLVADENGRKHRWRAEWAGAGTLLGQGVRADSLVIGDTLVLTGNPVRAPERYALRLTSVLRPADGFGWGFSGETSD